MNTLISHSAGVHGQVRAFSEDTMNGVGQYQK